MKKWRDPPSWTCRHCDISYDINTPESTILAHEARCLSQKSLGTKAVHIGNWRDRTADEKCEMLHVFDPFEEAQKNVGWGAVVASND